MPQQRPPEGFVSEDGSASKDHSDHTASKEERQALADFLRSYRVQDDWDLVIFGDGSGSTWERPCGWAAVSVEKATWKRLVWWGGMNHGTVNVGEIMACLQPLAAMADYNVRQRGHHGLLPVLLRVHVFTDSQYVQERGDVGSRHSPSNAVWWAAIDALQRSGLRVTWHWLRRLSNPFHTTADVCSKLARLLIQGYDLQQALQEKLARAQRKKKEK